MKLNVRESIIVDTLVNLGMNENIAHNADAIKEVLNISNEVLGDVDVINYTAEKDNVENILKSIVNENGSITYVERSQKNEYVKGKDGKDVFDQRVTQEIKTNIDVDEKNRTIKTINKDRIHGYAGRDFTHPSCDANFQDYTKLQDAPNGVVVGDEFKEKVKIITENGIETGYSQSERAEKFVKERLMRLSNDGNVILPKLENGQYYFGKFEHNKGKYANTGLGHEDLVKYVDNGTKFEFVRNQDLITANAHVSQNEVEYTGAEQFVYGNGGNYGPQGVPLPDVMIGSENFTSHFINQLPAHYGNEYTNIYSALESLKTDEGRKKIKGLYEMVDKYRKDPKYKESAFEYNPKLKELDEIRKGNLEPEKVILEDLTNYKEQVNKKDDLAYDKEQIDKIEGTPEHKIEGGQMPVVKKSKFEQIYDKAKGKIKGMLSAIKNKLNAKDKEQEKEEVNENEIDER